MVNLPLPRLNKCFLGHKWITVKDTGINLYMECLHCNTRMVKVNSTSGYQPIDRLWLDGHNKNI